jgi:hypothetical protein
VKTFALRSSPQFLFQCILFEFEKAMNSLSQGAVEQTETGEGNVQESMLAASLHQLRDFTVAVNVHHNEQIFLCCYADNLSGTGDFFRMMIRFNNNAGNRGVHSTPQQK